MKLLLAPDDSACSEAALAALIDPFSPGGIEMRVIHVLEWPRALSTSLAFGGRRGLDRVLLGSVSDGVVRRASCVVRRARCSVHVVRARVRMPVRSSCPT